MDDVLTHLRGDCRELLAGMPAQHVQSVVTSPPYLWQRRYTDDPREIGQEQTVGAYVQALVDVFDQVRRVLRPDGTLWLNLGDTYSRKRLLGVPWRVALSLQDQGWMLRNEIIWSKPRPKPDSVSDRCVVSHETVFLFSTRARYYFDWRAIGQENASASRTRRQIALQRFRDAGLTEHHLHAIRAVGLSDTGKVRNVRVKRLTSDTVRLYQEARAILGGETRELLITERGRPTTVWTIPTEALHDDHTAPMPQMLAERCIRAGSRPGDLVLDPFAGSGTTGRAALALGRRAVLIDLDYDDMQRRRTDGVQQMLF